MNPEENFSMPVTARRYGAGNFDEAEVRLAEERPLTIFLNDDEIVTLLCIPDYPQELAVGFMASEGLLQSPDQIADMEVDRDKGMVYIRTREPVGLPAKLFMKRTITSGCARGATFYNALDALTIKPAPTGFTVDPEKILDLMRQLSVRSELYKETHGVHNSALADASGLLVYHSDVGRHNAVDKIYGECFLKKIPMDDKLLLTTGRITSEIVMKTGHLGVSVLVSRHMATSLGLSMAKTLNMTLVGYVRSGKMFVFTGIERVIGAN
ncbi:MAG: formate dehydrogenase accessory sulfurtransferase FdhD [Deltaproteobacteria bacterium]|nr:formate dehydrogenase accessory sulfurtransferase FdhD [Deltaproteobacteria bacterium]